MECYYLGAPRGVLKPRIWGKACPLHQVLLSYNISSIDRMKWPWTSKGLQTSVWEILFLTCCLVHIHLVTPCHQQAEKARLPRMLISLLLGFTPTSHSSAGFAPQGHPCWVTTCLPTHPFKPLKGHSPPTQACRAAFQGEVHSLLFFLISPPKHFTET